jgi:hypothetical protein
MVKVKKAQKGAGIKKDSVSRKQKMDSFDALEKRLQKADSVQSIGKDSYSNKRANKVVGKKMKVGGKVTKAKSKK